MFIGDCLSRKSSIVLLYLHDLFNKKNLSSQFETKGCVTECKVCVAKYDTLNKCIRKTMSC